VADRLTPEETIKLLNLLEATLDAIPDGILALDLDRRIVAYNRQYLRMFDFTADQLRQGGIDWIIQALAPLIEGRDEVLSASAPIWSQPDHDSLDEMRFKDGRVYERIISPNRRGAQVLGLVASFRDISHAKQTEQALEQHRAFLEKAQEVAHIGSWVAEMDGSDRLGWSGEAHRIFGLTATEFEGTHEAFFTRVHQSDRDAVRAASDAALEGTRPYDIEHRIVRPDGSVRWVHEKADIVRDDGGAPLRMIGTMQDVTERRLLEDQLRQSQKMEAIGRLAGGIAHDLNNALTAIAGYSELAIGQLAASHPARADVEEIRRGAERAGSVTRQLLAFSRKELLEPRLFDVNQTISALGRLLSRLLGADIEVRTELAPSVPPILGDPGQFEQAVINLAVNARDAMPHGGRLLLSTAVEDLDLVSARANMPMAPGRYIVLRVSDSGHGMTPDTLAHIFEPFFTTKEPGKGTGLGLSMVYGTLKQIGGFIFADSEVGRGTTFRLYFRPAAARQPDSPAAAAAPTEPDSEGRPTVLVVEDEAAVRNLVASTLRKEGYRLLLAGSAEEAIEIAAANPDGIDLLLTDAIMPGKSGLDLAQELVSRSPRLRVIVMSGYTQDTLSGLNDSVELLQKPFAPRELRQRIRVALDQAKENSRLR
jgi:PAS domain S-box-containing protein